MTMQYHGSAIVLQTFYASRCRTTTACDSIASFSVRRMYFLLIHALLSALLFSQLLFSFVVSTRDSDTKGVCVGIAWTTTMSVVLSSRGPLKKKKWGGGGGGKNGKNGKNFVF